MAKETNIIQKKSNTKVLTASTSLQPKLQIINVQSNLKVKPTNTASSSSKNKLLSLTQTNSRAQSTGVYSERNSLNKPTTGLSVAEIFKNSNHKRNDIMLQSKAAIFQGVLVKSIDKDYSSKQKTDQKPIKSKRLIDEVNSNLEKLKIGGLKGSLYQPNRIEQKPQIQIITTKLIQKEIVNKAQSPSNKNTENLAKNKLSSSNNIQSTLLTNLNKKLIPYSNQTEKENTNKSSIPSTKNEAISFNKPNLKTASSTSQTNKYKKSYSINKKNNQSTLKEIRNYLDKDKDQNKKAPAAKLEAVNILKNLNINNSNALDSLLQKNNKAIEKITNQNQEGEYEEIVYPSIDKSNIDHTYSVTYNKIVNCILQSFQQNRKYPETDLSFYKFGRQLGRGAFGKVNLGVHILTGKTVAIKSFKLNDKEINSIRRRLHLETQLMKTLNHLNVLKMYETFETTNYLMIVVEFISGGDLLSFLRKRNKVSEPVAKFLFKQLMEGLKYMHSQGIIHRDVKLDNILLDADSSIKLCDLGVSKLIKQGEIMTEQCGTPAYIAPEIISGEGYSGFGADMWSAGVVLYALLSGTMPFKANNMNDLQNLIISSNYSEIKEVSKDASNLINELLELDPKKRLTADQALRHPFFKDVRKSMK